MAESNRIVKAAQAEILLGEIRLDVLQMPNGEYRLSLSQVLEAIDASSNWISTITKRQDKSLKWLQSKGYTGSRIKARVDFEGGATQVQTISIADAIAVWRWFDRQDNELAGAIIDACVAESIERRADAAFEVQRTEEERNDRFSARVKGKIVRVTLTDAVQSYLDRHSELSDNDRKWLYNNASDLVNLTVFGRKAKRLVEDFGASRERLRDWMTADELKWVAEVEDLAARLIENSDIHPCDAVKESGRRLIIPIVDRRQIA